MADGAARPPLLIVARSARLLAEAAARSWTPYTVDLFADADTRAVAAHCERVAATPDLAFRADALVRAIRTQVVRTGPMPLVCGSGLERLAGVARDAAHGCAVAMPSPAVFARLRDMPAVLAALATRGVAVPETSARSPSRTAGWLHKRGGSSGGFHVRPARGDECGGYYQREIGGGAGSGLFFATTAGCALLGLHRHLRWSHDARARFAYQGARSWDDAPAALATAVQDFGEAVARELGLRGLFGLDFVCRADGAAPLLVDINPRPPATLELFPAPADLLDAHVAVCLGREPLLYSRRPPDPVRGHAIVFTRGRWRVPARFRWPSVAADRPPAGEALGAGAPLCTLRVTGADAAAVARALEAGRRALAQAIGDERVLPAATIINVGGSPYVESEAG